MEYRHGPISITTERHARPGCSATRPTGSPNRCAAPARLWIAGGLDPLAELVRAQRLAVAVAAARGLDPDRPRHLTRSVILAP